MQGDRQLLAAGGSEDTADQDYSFLNFGGGYFGTNLFLLEGGYDVAQGWGGILYVPAPEDTEQVKVTSYSFSAEYGFSTGNAISITTKAGTARLPSPCRRIHAQPGLGRQPLLQQSARPCPRPDDHRNQFGIAGGGPLYIPGIYKQRDKTFFFANYEGLRLNGARTYSANVPTTAELGGELLVGADYHSGLGTRMRCAGPSTRGRSTTLIPPDRSRLPALRPITPSDKPFTSAIPIRETKYPQPASGQSTLWRINLPRETTGRRQRIRAAGYNFNTTASAPTTSNEWGIRIDQNINANNRIYGQFSNKHEGKVQTSAFYGNDIAGPYKYDPNNRMFGVLGYSHVFTPTFVLTSDLFFIRNPGGNSVQGYPFKPSSLGLPAQLDSWTPQFPQVQFGNTFGGSPYAPLGATQNSGEAGFPQNNGSLTVDVNKSFQSTFHLGRVFGRLANRRRRQTDPDSIQFLSCHDGRSRPTRTRRSSTNGDAFASFMAGAGNSGNRLGRLHWI